MIAHVVDAAGDTKAIIKVPVILDGMIPDVPRLVECNGWFAYLHRTNPLQYVWIDPPVNVEKI